MFIHNGEFKNYLRQNGSIENALINEASTGSLSLSDAFALQDLLEEEALNMPNEDELFEDCPEDNYENDDENKVDLMDNVSQNSDDENIEDETISNDAGEVEFDENENYDPNYNYDSEQDVIPDDNTIVADDFNGEQGIIPDDNATVADDFNSEQNPFDSDEYYDDLSYDDSFDYTDDNTYTENEYQLDNDDSMQTDEQIEFEYIDNEINSTYSNNLANEAQDEQNINSDDKIKQDDLAIGEDVSKKVTDDSKVDSSDKNKSEDTVKIENKNNSPSSSIKNTSGSSGVSSGYSYGGGSYLSNGSSNVSKIEKAPTLEELESQKTEKEGELSDAETELQQAQSGETVSITNAKNNCDSAKLAYEEVVESDVNIKDEQKKKLNNCMRNINGFEILISKNEMKISENESQIFSQKATLNADQANLDALNAALSKLQSQSSDDPEKQKEINSMISTLNGQITNAQGAVDDDNNELVRLNKIKTALEESKAQKQELLDAAKAEKEEIEKGILNSCSDEVKRAMEAYNDAKAELDTTKETEISNAQNKVTEIQDQITALDTQINDLKAKQTQKEYSVSNFDFSDFDLNLSGEQQSSLELFKQNWEENKDKYEAVEKATGIPAELVASIHWRESGANFDTYLHNGQKLGQVTTAVPAGIYFDDWTEAAIDAMSKYGTGANSVDKNDIQSYYNYAEHYNGMGYSMYHDMNSPYVWAGTSNYTSGKYVADGKFDPNHVDQQLGVAVMLNALLS